MSHRVGFAESWRWWLIVAGAIVVVAPMASIGYHALGSSLVVAILALLSLRLFVTDSFALFDSFRRPLGQMFLATFLSFLVAFAGGVTVAKIWSLGNTAQEWSLLAAGVATGVLGFLVPFYAWWQWFGERGKPLREYDISVLQARRDLTYERLALARTVNTILMAEAQRLGSTVNSPSDQDSDVSDVVNSVEHVEHALEDETDDVLTEEEIRARRDEILRLSEEYRRRRGSH
jgi:hypothetical protein